MNWHGDELTPVQVLDKYNQGIEARNRMLELILPGKVVFLRPRKVCGHHHLLAQ